MSRVSLEQWWVHVEGKYKAIVYFLLWFTVSGALRDIFPFTIVIGIRECGVARLVMCKFTSLLRALPRGYGQGTWHWRQGKVSG